MSSDPHNEFEAIELTEEAGRQLDEIRQEDMALYARIMKEIQDRLAAWSPGDDHRPIIKHVNEISKRCGRPVYRVKSPPTIQKWRVFFTVLDGKRPPVRLVLAVVEYASEQQCYDDMAQEHMKTIRRRILEAGTRGEFKGRRR